MGRAFHFNLIETTLIIHRPITSFSSLSFCLASSSSFSPFLFFLGLLHSFQLCRLNPVFLIGFHAEIKMNGSFLAPWAYTVEIQSTTHWFYLEWFAVIRVDGNFSQKSRYELFNGGRIESLRLAICSRRNSLTQERHMLCTFFP